MTMRPVEFHLNYGFVWEIGIINDKRLLRHARSMELDGFLDISAALQSVSHHTEDHREAIEAIFEKRPGDFKGR